MYVVEDPKKGALAVEIVEPKGTVVVSMPSLGYAGSIESGEEGDADRDHVNLANVTTDELRRSIAHLSKPRVVFHNWAMTFYSRTKAVYKPRTVADVRTIVELARREGRELRAAGSGHSPSDLVCTDGYIINLDHLNRMLRVDRDAQTFYAEGGMKVSEAHKHLAENDLAMSSLGSISDQTLAGAVSTSTHGSSMYFGSLSTTVTAIDIVLPLPGAPVKRIDKDQDPDLFKASLCGLGATGIIVALGMRVEKRFKLEEELFVVRYADFVKYWDVIARSAQHSRCWWFPQLGLVKISRLNRTDKPLTPKPSFLSSWITNTLLAKYVHACALVVSKAFPKILPYHAWFMWHFVHCPTPIDWRNILFPRFAPPPDRIETKPAAVSLRTPVTEGREAAIAEAAAIDLPMLSEPVTRVDWSVEVFNYDCGFPQYTYEAAVPVATTTACLEDLERWHAAELYSKDGLRTHFPYEVRWTAADDIWLSPTYGTAATYIGAIQYRPFGLAVPYKRIWRAFSGIMTQHGARPHWAKSHTLSLDDLKTVYPRLEEWLNVRKKVDPSGTLANPYIRRHLLGHVGEDVDMRRFKKTPKAVL